MRKASNTESLLFHMYPATTLEEEGGLLKQPEEIQGLCCPSPRKRAVSSKALLESGRLQEQSQWASEKSSHKLPQVDAL